MPMSSHAVSARLQTLHLGRKPTKEASKIAIISTREVFFTEIGGGSY
jgi:hypothetical protein